jgi:hypothetical protein
VLREIQRRRSEPCISASDVFSGTCRAQLQIAEQKEQAAKAAEKQREKAAKSLTKKAK